MYTKTINRYDLKKILPALPIVCNKKKKTPALQNMIYLNAPCYKDIKL